MQKSSAIPFERRLIPTELGYLHLRSMGQGPDIVFLHQNPASGKMFHAVMARLAAQFRCIAPDMIGMGDSDPAPRLLELEEQAAAIEHAVAAIGCTEAILVGVHTGAYLAALIAGRGLLRVRAALLSGYPIYESWEAQVERFANCKPLSIDADGTVLAELWRAGSGAAAGLSEEDRLISFADRLRAGKLYFMPYVKLFQADLMAPLMALQCPVGFVAGSRDPFSRLQARAAAAVTGATERVIPDGSALLCLESPDLFVELIHEIAARAAPLAV